ncbi:SIMPL domain-containing protein [Microvirga massiliensis]|uniref:SIMPL domain-containing protein n=1 Tax=Microvirga massiliensis TaxID=1033741 RepID=UPI00062B5489|nr:SIMPL domain-containing protein [Microvirga massiliensis]
MNPRRLTFVALSLALTASPALSQPTDLPPRITITGTGKVTATPDIASVSIGVVTSAETASEALRANNSAMGETTDMLVRTGVERRDMVTSGFSVQPQYDGRSGKPIQVGFSVTNSLSVRLRDISRVGDVLDAAVKLGSNQIGGIAFDISNKEPFLVKAREAAVADAKQAAQTFARAADLKLVRIISITESYDTGGPRPMEMRTMAVASSVPIQPGENTVKASVTIAWEIEPAH